MPTILIVEDDAGMNLTMGDALIEEGFDAVHAHSLHEARLFSRNPIPDVVVSDLILPDGTGIDLLGEFLERKPVPLLFLITAYATVESAIEALKMGVEDYLVKPFDLDELVLKIRKALHVRKLEGISADMDRSIYVRYPCCSLVAASPAMTRVLATIRQVASTRVNILLVGETGVGKDLLACAIHNESPWNRDPFIKVNCAAIPDQLLESELFGFEKGAFTGAEKEKPGKIEMADGGTFLLEEVTELPLTMQGKLLRVIQEKEVDRLGGTKTHKVDVRFIASTNRNLERAVADGSFRQDLFYRLNVIQIEIPPLRERVEDIPYLFFYFFNLFRRKYEKGEMKVDPDVIEVLKHQPFPGNVRELQHLVERIVIMVPGRRVSVRAIHNLIQEEAREEEILPLKQATRAFESQYIRKALMRVKGRRAEAAKLLKISRKTLWAKLNRQ